MALIALIHTNNVSMTPMQEYPIVCSSAPARLCRGFLFLYQHDLPCNAALPEQLVGVAGVCQRESLSDERLELLLLKEIKERGQILAEPGWPHALEPLNAVWDQPFTAGKQPAFDNVSAKVGGQTKAMPAARGFTA